MKFEMMDRLPFPNSRRIEGTSPKRQFPSKYFREISYNKGEHEEEKDDIGGFVLGKMRKKLEQTSPTSERENQNVSKIKY